MNIGELFLLAIGLSMDAFAVSICKGLSIGTCKRKDLLLAGSWFGGFQALMPLISYLLGSLFTGFIYGWTHWIAFGLLLALGINMIKESREEAECMDADMGVKAMLFLAVATSIDALAVGVSFAALQVAIIPAVILIGCTTFAFSAFGMKIGGVVGEKYNSKAELTGGIILILIGLKILLEGLGIL